MSVQFVDQPASPILRDAATPAVRPSSIPPARPLKDLNSVRSRTQMDALRFCAIFIIMIHHFYDVHRPFGPVGTNFFFVMTGYLAASQLMKAREQIQAGVIPSKWHAAFSFIKRRWMRILPIMWLMLTAAIVLHMKGVKEIAVWQYLLASNIYVFKTGDYPHYISHLWWISGIEQTLPFIIVIFLVTPMHWLSRVLAGLVILGPAFRMTAWAMGMSYVPMRVLPPAFVDIVAMGCLIAVAIRHKNERLLNLLVWLGLTVSLVIIPVCIYEIKQTSTDWTISLLFDAASTWFACALIIKSHRGLGGLVGNLLASKPMSYLGAISYGMGMWHLVLLALFTKMNGNPFGKPNALTLQTIIAIEAFFGTFVVASVTYWLIERPVARMKEKMTPGKPAAQAVHASTPIRPPVEAGTVSADESPFATGELAKS